MKADALLEERPFDVPSSDADPFSAAFFDDPFPTLQSSREAGPVVWLNRYGVPAIARFAEVTAVLNDWKNFSSASGVGYANTSRQETWRPPSALVEADPPDHTRTRAVVQRILSAVAMKKLRASFMEAAEKAVDAALDRGTIDGVADLAEAYPLSVFPDALGMSKDGREHILPYASVVFNAFGPDNELKRGAVANAAPHVQWVMDQCRESRGSDGFGGEIFAAAKRGEITEDEAVLLIRSLFSAGVDTTVSGLSAALLHLACAPKQFQALRRDPTLARASFEEAIRLESPLQSLFRTTHAHGADVAGFAIQPHAKVLVLLSSANRDPRRWEKPEEYNIKRQLNGHVGFGSGIHMCVGQLVTRLEGECLLSALASKVAAMELDGAPVQAHNNILRALARLPLRLKPSRGPMH